MQCCQPSMGSFTHVSPPDAAATPVTGNSIIVTDSTKTNLLIFITSSSVAEAVTSGYLVVLPPMTIEATVNLEL